jgi:hypothetical protein
MHTAAGRDLGKHQVTRLRATQGKPAAAIAGTDLAAAGEAAATG